MAKINETINSPNQTNRGGQIPQLIVCHICDGTYTGTKSWFLQSTAQTSSHFIVAQDGRICQCVPLDRMAWCNGTVANASVPLVKQLGGNPNLYTVSIEHEGYYSVTRGALTEAQLDVTVWLIGYINEQLKTLYGSAIPLDRNHIVGHNEINSVTRSNCPGQLFPWSELMTRLNPPKEQTENENVAYVTRVAYNENYEYAKANLAKAKAAGFDGAYIQVVERIKVEE